MKEYKSKSKEGKLYIAYGSNLNVDQMKFRCPTATIVYSAEIKNYELVFRGSKTGSYATIEQCEAKIVPVVLWKTTEEDELALDNYEGYPKFYGKEEMELEVDGKSVSAYVYIMPQSHQLGMPTQNYIDCILEGYDSAGFDPQILLDALETTEQKMDDLPQEHFSMEWR